MRIAWCRTSFAALFVVALLLAIPVLVSANIQVDGDPSDWSGVDYEEVNDSDESGIPSKFDIDFVRFHWDSTNQKMYWMMQTYGSIDNDTGFDDETEYLFLDTDRNINTGGEAYGEKGMDYRFFYSQLTSSYAFQEWTESTTSWDNVTGYTYEYAQETYPSSGDYDCFEIMIPYDAITDGGTEELKHLQWGWVYENADEPADDKAPDDLHHDSDVPEPGTTAMLVIGLAGLVYLKRRQDLQK